MTYDANETSFKNILDYLFRIHNPTTVDQQGNDMGSSYRSTIFYQNEEEKQTAKEEVIAIVNESNKRNEKVFITLEPYSTLFGKQN